MVMDITAPKLAEQKLAALALFDTLTGLANRHQFTERLQSLLAQRDDPLVPVTLMFLDVDRFKSINDSLGHAAGDEVLKEFAHRLADAVRPTDVVARLAGDEFVVILEELRDRASVQAIAQKVLAAMAAQFNVEGRALSVSTSMGIARAAAHETSPAELLAAADGALYEAKARGRGTFVISSHLSASTGTDPANEAAKRLASTGRQSDAVMLQTIGPRGFFVSIIPRRQARHRQGVQRVHPSGRPGSFQPGRVCPHCSPTFRSERSSKAAPVSYASSRRLGQHRLRRCPRSRKFGRYAASIGPNLCS